MFSSLSEDPLYICISLWCIMNHYNIILACISNADFRVEFFAIFKSSGVILRKYYIYAFLSQHLSSGMCGCEVKMAHLVRCLMIPTESHPHTVMSVLSACTSMVTVDNYKNE